MLAKLMSLADFFMFPTDLFYNKDLLKKHHFINMNLATERRALFMCRASLSILRIIRTNIRSDSYFDKT